MRTAKRSSKTGKRGASQRNKDAGLRCGGGCGFLAFLQGKEKRGPKCASGRRKNRGYDGRVQRERWARRGALNQGKAGSGTRAGAGYGERGVVG